MNAYKRMNAYSCTGIFVLIVEAAYLIKEKILDMRSAAKNNDKVEIKFPEGKFVTYSSQYLHKRILTQIKPLL
jgi:hypothetical protein